MKLYEGLSACELTYLFTSGGPEKVSACAQTNPGTPPFEFGLPPGSSPREGRGGNLQTRPYCVACVRVQRHPVRCFLASQSRKSGEPGWGRWAGMRGNSRSSAGKWSAPREAQWAAQHRPLEVHPLGVLRGPGHGLGLIHTSTGTLVNQWGRITSTDISG